MAGLSEAATDGRWSTLRQAKIHFKSDGRIFGDSDFVDKVLKTADEALEHKYQLKTQGYDLNALAGKSQGKKHFLPLASPRAWVYNDGAGPKLNISQPAVSISVQRGARIEEKNGYSLITE